MGEVKKLLSVVVPCYNEEDVLMSFYDTTLTVLDGMSTELDYEFIFVDDGSKDRTLSIMRELAGIDDNVRYVSFSRNFGKEAAILAGLKAATGEFVVLMDADLQHPPKYLPEMYEKLKDGKYDSVAMKRTDRKGEGMFRRLFSGLFFKLMTRLAGNNIPEGATDFRMMSRQFVDSVLSLTEYNRFTKGIFGWVGYETCWISYKDEQRAGGKSKWKTGSLVRYSIDGMVAFSTKPLAFASATGFLLFVLSTLTMLVFVVKTLIWGDPVAGFPTLICVILMMSGLQILFLGILGQYFAKAYMEVKGRPVYITKESNLNSKEEDKES
ncbi:MAG: glycosyltransferase family 2 protein [Lachnospiraceae bacterium]|nr:glycosyltransferase family 2 protein [Lachnospiraceae bacterium]